MSPKSLDVEILSPHRQLYKSSAYSVQVPLHDGLIGILPGHAPLRALLGYGILRLKDEEGEKSFVIDGGFAEIKAGKVDILAKHSEKAEEIGIEKAKEDYESAQKLKARGEEEIEHRRQLLLAARTRLQYLGDKNRA